MHYTMHLVGLLLAKPILHIAVPYTQSNGKRSAGIMIVVRIYGLQSSLALGFDILGADFAKTHDFNVATIINRQTKHVDYIERWNNTSWITSG